MDVRDLHPWNLAPGEAREVQRQLRDRLVLEDTFRLEDLRRVAGVDNAYSRRGQPATAHAVVVVLSYPEMEVLEVQAAERPVEFPYVPGLLSFREAPVVIEALRKVTCEPDLVLFDGQGLAHPRRLGLASHLGLLIDRPSVGCAKSRLVGAYEEPPRELGAWTPLRDGEEVIGAAVRTRPTHSPLFVSPGHRVSLETAVRAALACCREGRFLPEPTRLAHNEVDRCAHPERHPPPKPDTQTGLDLS